MRLVTILLVEVLNPLFVISLALFVSLGYILSLLLPVTIGLWQLVLALSIVVPLFPLLLRARQLAGHTATDRASAWWRALLPLLPLLIFVPILAVEFAYPYLQIASHGDIHVGYIHQLLYGSTPIENVFLPGYPANYYWLYHAYIASIVAFTSKSPSLVSSLLNLVAICSCLMWIGQTLLLLNLGKRRTLKLGLMLMFVYCAINITGCIRVLHHILNGTYIEEGYWIRLFMLEFADRRLSGMIVAALEFGSMSIGFAVLAAGFYACARIINRHVDLVSLVLISACGIVTLAVQQVFTLYIVVVLLGGLVLVGATYLLWVNDKINRIKTKLRFATVKNYSSLFVAWLTLSCILSLPLLKYNHDIGYNLETVIKFGITNNKNIPAIVAADLLLLPLFALQWIYVLRRADPLRLYVQICASIALVFTFLLALFPDNQYKGVFFLSTLLAISTLLALENLQRSKSLLIRRLGWTVAITVFVCMMMTQVFINHFYVRRNLYREIEGLRYERRHFTYVEDFDKRSKAFYWIRDNTPYDSVIVLPLYISKFSNIFYERLPYAKRSQITFTENIPAYHERVQVLELFFSGDTSPDQYQMLLAKMLEDLTGRPFYAVVRDSEISPQVMEERGARLVFEPATNVAKVYWLNPDSAP